MDLEQQLKTLRDDVRDLRNDMDRRNRPLLLPDGARVMKVTTRIPAADGFDWKKGQAVDGKLVPVDGDPGTLTYTETGGDATDVWNMHEKGFEVGGLVLALVFRGRVCAFDVDACVHYR